MTHHYILAGLPSSFPSQMTENMTIKIKTKSTQRVLRGFNLFKSVSPLHWPSVLFAAEFKDVHNDKYKNYFWQQHNDTL